MAHVIKNYKYLNKGPLMWKLGDILIPVLKVINDCKKAANTPVSTGNRGAYVFLDVRTHGNLITGTRGQDGFIWSDYQWYRLGNVTA